MPPASPAEGIAPDALPLQPDERVVAAFRANVLQDPAAPLRIATGDVLYLLVRNESVDRISALFAARPLPGPLAQRRFFGDFTLDPAAPLADVCAVYGVTPPAELVGLGLAEVFARRIKGVPVVGDRVVLGEIELVVKETEGKAISKVGLVLHRAAPRNAGQ